MSAETLVTGLNVFYLALMGLVSLVGTLVLVKLVFTFRRVRMLPPAYPDFQVEDA